MDHPSRGAKDGALQARPEPGDGDSARFRRRWDPGVAKEARTGMAAPTRFFKKPALWVALAVLLALAVRIPHSWHPLAWDEAKLMLSLRELVVFGGFDVYWRIHGPGYLLAVLPVAYLTRVSPSAISMTSTLFSLGLVVATYRLARELFDDDAAVISAFAMAFMPLNVVFSTWMKQDSLMTLLLVISALLFVRGRWVLASLPLAAALFVKEYALLFMGAVFFWTLFSFQWDRLWRWCVTCVAAGAMSLWYFALIGMTSGQFVFGFVGVGKEAEDFGRPWYQYLVKAPHDYGWIVVVLVLIGMVYAAWRWGKDDYGYVLPLAWSAVILIIHSVSVVKGQWYPYYATPGLAMLAGIGGSFVIKLAGQEMWRRGTVAAAMIVGMALPAVTLDYRRFTKGESYFEDYGIGRSAGIYLKQVLRPGDRVGFGSILDPLTAWYSGASASSFEGIPSAAKADILRSMQGTTVPYEGQTRDFLKSAESRHYAWIVLPGYDPRYKTEFDAGRSGGGRVRLFGPTGRRWAVVETRHLWQ